MWDILVNEDEAMIADSVRDYLAAEMPLDRLRPGGKAIEPAAARAGMAELGLFGIGLPEIAGGTGQGLVEEVLVQRECGRFAITPGVLASVLAAHVACEAGDHGLARAVVTGGQGAALVLPGTPSFAFDADPADLLVAWNAEGMGLFDPAALAGRVADRCLDDSVSMERGVLDLAEARLWISAGQAPLPQRAAVLLAAALVGLADHACDLAVGYAKVREQYGKPIGAFQAIKHRCADMGVRTRLAWYQTCLAALKLAHGADDAALQVASAKLLAAEAAHENGRACVQIHGGIGFQSECDAHWFVKRAHLYDRLGGDAREQARLAASAPSLLS